MDKNQIKKMIAHMKSALNSNFEKRQQHVREPELFIDSEAEVHNAIKSLQ